VVKGLVLTYNIHMPRIFSLTDTAFMAQNVGLGAFQNIRPGVRLKQDYDISALVGQLLNLKGHPASDFGSIYCFAGLCK